MKIIVFIFCLIIFKANAQKWEWARKSTSTTAKQYSKKIKTDKFGNAIIMGVSQGLTMFNNFQIDSGAFIVKYNSSGSVLWAENIGSDISDFSFDAVGNIYVAGNFKNNASLFNTTLTSKGGTDFYFLKLDYNGNPITIKSFGGIGNDGVNAIVCEPNGNFYLSGYFHDTIRFDSKMLTDTVTWGQHFFTVKLNSTGVAQWADKGLSYMTSADLVCLDKKNMLYVIGKWEYPCLYCDGKMLIEYDSLGNTKRTKQVGWSMCPIWDFTVSDSLNVYVISSWGSHYGEWPQITKYDFLMNPKWSNDLGTGCDGYYLTKGLSVDSLENIYVAGNLWRQDTNKDSVTLGGQWIHIKGGTDGIITKISSGGNYIWLKTFGADGTEYPSDMALDNSGRLFVTGNFHSSNMPISETVNFDNDSLTNDGSWQQIFIAKLNPNFFYVFVPEILYDVNHIFNVYPNPSSNIFNVHYKGDATYLKINITNQFGQLVLSKKHAYQSQLKDNFDLSSEPKGVYFIELIADDKSEVKKIVVQ
jgi:hypothetical protein